MITKSLGKCRKARDTNIYLELMVMNLKHGCVCFPVVFSCMGTGME